MHELFGKRFPWSDVGQPEMEPIEREFVEWMREQFRLRPDLTQSDLARFLGIHRNNVHNMLKGNRKRGITLSERSAIQQFFGASVASPTIRPPIILEGILVKARIGPHIWQSENVPESEQQRIGSPSLGYPAAEQIAYELAVSSKDGEFKKNDFVYTVPFEAYRTRMLQNDVVVLHRRRDGLISYALARAVSGTANAVTLQPIIDGEEARAALNEGEIIGLVIGVYRPTARRT